MEVMKVDISTAWDIYEKDIGPEVIESRKELSNELREKKIDVKRLCKSVLSFEA